MRTLLQVLLIFLGAVVAVAAVAAAAIFFRSSRQLHRHYGAAVTVVPILRGPAAVSQGRHIAAIRGCLACHGADLGGAKVMDDPAMGRVYGPNLTTGKGGRGAALSNGDWVRAVRHGIGADGRPLVVMPSEDYAGLSDEDLGALLGYIQSVPPVDRTVPTVTVGPVMRALLALGKIRLAAAVIDQKESGPVAAVPVAITPAYGRYLASTCSGCHNPDFSGGKIAAGPPSWPPAANLTAGAGSGVLGWSEADFIRALRQGTTPEGRTINPVMPRAFGHMSDVELKALWTYLQTVPAAATGKRPVTAL